MKHAEQNTLANTIVWAIDPFEETRPNKLLIQKIESWFLKGNFPIMPAYVFSVKKVKAGELPEEERLSQTLEDRKENSEKYLHDLGMKDVSATVLPVRSSERHREIEEILDFAKRQMACCLMLSSHGRSGLPRLMMGSFAENLLTLSPYPVFFLPQSSKNHTESTKKPLAFFATDFSILSQKAFDNFLMPALALNLDLVLFHSVSLPSVVLEGGYGVPIVLPDNFFSSQVEWAEKKGQLWIQKAQGLGLNARLIVQDSGIGPNTAQVILQVAEREAADMVVTTSASSESTSFFLGSVAREVFRSRSLPVWVYGPRSLGPLESKATTRIGPVLV